MAATAAVPSTHNPLHRNLGSNLRAFHLRSHVPSHAFSGAVRFGPEHPRQRSVSRRRAPAAASAALFSPAGGLEGSRLPDQFLELTSQEELDAVIADAERDNQLVLVEWMAQWCRKCIYLKPKIEKLVHEYPRVRCCAVDVNKVPFSFVKNANITKMPTLQLWVKGQQAEELVGGEQAFLVLDKTRAMIKRHL